MSVKLSPAQQHALKYASNDGVLLIPKRGSFGSMDTRDDVSRRSVMLLLDRGYLRLVIDHGDDAADGFSLTDKGAEAVKSFSE
jgi:hypothetical protein